MADERVEQVAKWCYTGVWRLVTEWFKVPEHPPVLPSFGDIPPRAFKPALGYLKYLKFYFWIGLFSVDIALTIGWLAILAIIPLIGFLISPLAFAVIVLPDIVAYIAIHLRFDTTWYVVSDRSMRIRRGIWTIHETTITFENIQNVSVSQGPVQRWFGIADVVVETAGGGGSNEHAAAQLMGHHGILQGVDNAYEIRDLILSRIQAHRSAGLGDDAFEHQSGFNTRNEKGLRSEHLAVLREIRDNSGDYLSATNALKQRKGIST